MKIWLCGMTSAGNYQNLKELIEPILEYFDGLVWTFHLPNPATADNTFDFRIPIDEGFNFLEENKKEGKIILCEWTQRHFNSMNQYLWQGPMQEGDYFVQIDTLERLGKEFCEERLRDLCENMERGKVGLVSNKGKGLIFRYQEVLEFRGSPHWY